jgi:hypothetical protein
MRKVQDLSDPKKVKILKRVGLARAL